nr:gag pol polyprotein [Hymenolepis microstoma]
MSKETELAIPLNTPAFDPENSESWFKQFEMIIRLRGVTKRTICFQHLVPVLTTAIVTQFAELTSMPPDNDSYDRLKQTIISRLSVSREKRLDQLFAQVELGDRSPSQLLHHMRSLAIGSSVTDEILKKLWMKCLPKTLIPFSVTSPSRDNLDKLAEEANLIYDPQDGPVINAVKAPTAADPITRRLDKLVEQLQELKASRSSTSPRLNRRRPTSPRRWRSQARHDDSLLLPQNFRARQAVKATAEPGFPSSRLLYVVDRNSKLRFLVDTGSEIGVFPRSGEKRCLKPTGTLLLAANNSRICTSGQKFLNLDLGLRREFPYVFLIADVKKTHYRRRFPFQIPENTFILDMHGVESQFMSGYFYQLGNWLLSSRSAANNSTDFMEEKQTPISDVEGAYDVCTDNRLAKFTSIWSALRDGLITPTDLCNHLLHVYCTVIFEVQRYWILCLLQFCANYSNELLEILKGYKDTLCEFEKSASENERTKLTQILMLLDNHSLTSDKDMHSSSWLPNKYVNGELTELFYYDLQKAFAKLSSSKFRKRINALTKSKSECINENDIDDCLEQVNKCESIWTHILTYYDPKLPVKEDKLFLSRCTHPEVLQNFECQRQKYSAPFGNAKEDLLGLKQNNRPPPIKPRVINPTISQSQPVSQQQFQMRCGEIPSPLEVLPEIDKKPSFPSLTRGGDFKDHEECNNNSNTYSTQPTQMTENIKWPSPQNTGMQERF